MKKFVLIVILLLLFVQLAYAGSDDFFVTSKPSVPAPEFSNPSPSNGSIVRGVSNVTWNITIHSWVTFNWTLECNNSQVSSGNYSSNGSFVLNLTGLFIGSVYTVWVNASDGNLTSSEFFIFTVLASVPGDTSTGGGGGFYLPGEEPVPSGVEVMDEATLTQVGISVLMVLFSVLIILLIVNRKDKKKRSSKKSRKE